MMHQFEDRNNMKNGAVSINRENVALNKAHLMMLGLITFVECPKKNPNRT